MVAGTWPGTCMGFSSIFRLPIVDGKKVRYTFPMNLFTCMWSSMAPVGRTGYHCHSAQYRRGFLTVRLFHLPLGRLTTSTPLALSVPTLLWVHPLVPADLLSSGPTSPCPSKCICFFSVSLGSFLFPCWGPSLSFRSLIKKKVPREWDPEISEQDTGAMGLFPEHQTQHGWCLPILYTWHPTILSVCATWDRTGPGGSFSFSPPCVQPWLPDRQNVVTWHKSSACVLFRFWRGADSLKFYPNHSCPLGS